MDNVISILAENGLKAEFKIVNKNGVMKDAIVVALPNSNMSPIFYVDSYSEMTDYELANYILDYVKNDTTTDQLNADVLADWDLVKDKLRLCIRPQTCDNTVVRKFLDLELYVRIQFNNSEGHSMSAKINNGMLDEFDRITVWDVSIDEVFEQAIFNMNYQKYSFMDSLNVGSTIDNYYGASIMADADFLKQTWNEFGSDFYILPSSVHEVLFVPVADGITVESLREMVAGVNATEVSEEDYLSDNVYFFDGEDVIIA